MSAVVPWVLAAATLALAAAHVAIVVGLARERAYVRAAVAFVVLPLAPYWAWRVGMRQRLYVWLGSLALYAIGVAVA